VYPSRSTLPLALVLIAVFLSAGPAPVAQAQAIDDPLAIELTEQARVSVADGTPMGPVVVGQLPPGESRFLDVPVTRDQCYSILAVGEATATDIDLHLYGGGIEVAADTAVDNQPAVHWCNAIFDRVSLEIRMYAGSGRYALQIFETPSPHADPLSARLHALAGEIGEGYVPAAAPELGVLAEGGEVVLDLHLAGDRDYVVAAVGAEGVEGIELSLAGASGGPPPEQQSDSLSDGVELLRIHSPPDGGVFPLRLVVQRGRGEFGVRVFVR
jgi:hypothetical protein